MLEFLTDAPDDRYLLVKGVAVVEIGGACGCEELLWLRLKDVEVNADVIIVSIEDSKNDMSRRFTITSSKNGVCGLEIVTKYSTLWLGQRLGITIRGCLCDVTKDNVTNIKLRGVLFLQFLAR